MTSGMLHWFSTKNLVDLGCSTNLRLPSLWTDNFTKLSCLFFVIAETLSPKCASLVSLISSVHPALSLSSNHTCASERAQSCRCCFQVCSIGAVSSGFLHVLGRISSSIITLMTTARVIIRGARILLQPNKFS
eukprot:scaffold4127_cov126-Cylindrotheca_fusiformis.AAC.6